MKSFLKINAAKSNGIKINPINPNLEESSIYKYGELCLVIKQTFQLKCNIAKRFSIAVCQQPIALVINKQHRF